MLLFDKCIEEMYEACIAQYKVLLLILTQFHQDVSGLRDLLGHVQELVQVHTSVGELPEGTLLLDFSISLKKT